MELQGPVLFIAGTLLVILIPLIGFLVRYAKVRFDLKLEQLKEQNKFFELSYVQQLLQIARDELQDIVEDVVDMLDQVYVKEWKEKAEDGKLTKEEIRQLNQMLIDNVKATLSTNSLELLEQSIPNLQQLIINLAEAYLDQKRSTEAVLGKA